ncbi:Loganate O-methyltransferase [Bertholletia excelsa]
MLTKAIDEYFDIARCSNTIQIAGLGSLSGPYAISVMEIIIEAIQNKYLFQDVPPNNIPEFQVFFSDLAVNDFNTLFTTLPGGKNYFSAGVPGSLYGRLFPKCSLQLVYCSYALRWLSELPEELLDVGSPAWNKGRIHYTGASKEVASAYSLQFSKDMANFLNARAEEIVGGGLIILTMPVLPEHDHFSNLLACVFFHLVEKILVDMVKEGSISEEELDSYNVPMYTCTAKEIKEAVEKNGCFTIERLEPILDSSSHIDKPVTFDVLNLIRHLKASFGAASITEHFGRQNAQKLFRRAKTRCDELSSLIQSKSPSGTLLFVVLKRK